MRRGQYRLKPTGYIVIGILALVVALCIYAIVHAIANKGNPDPSQMQLADITPTPDVVGTAAPTDTPDLEESDPDIVMGNIAGSFEDNEETAVPDNTETGEPKLSYVTPLPDLEEKAETGSDAAKPTATPRTPTSKEKKNAKAGVVTGDGVNLRSGPGTEYKKLGSYKLGSELQVYASDGSFYFVRMTKDGKTGFMSKKFVSTDVTTETTDSDAPKGSVSGKVKVSKVALRQAADTDSVAITELKKDDVVYVYSKSGKFYYVQVAKSGKKGYAFAEYISLDSKLPG